MISTYPITDVVRGYLQCGKRVFVWSLEGSILFSTLPSPEPPLWPSEPYAESLCWASVIIACEAVAARGGTMTIRRGRWVCIKKNLVNCWMHLLRSEGALWRPLLATKDIIRIDKPQEENEMRICVDYALWPKGVNENIGWLIPINYNISESFLSIMYNVY